MVEFETRPRQWGNSLGITIPREIVDKERLKPNKKIKVLILESDEDNLRRIFGSVQRKRLTQEVLDEIDAELS